MQKSREALADASKSIRQRIENKQAFAFLHSLNGSYLSSNLFSDNKRHVKINIRTKFHVQMTFGFCVMSN